MRGIHFLINETGHKTAAIVDLRVHGERWHEIKRLLENPSVQTPMAGVFAPAGELEAQDC